MEKLAKDFGIETGESGKHVRPGWVQFHCPFCGEKDKWFLGYNIARGYFNCWQCGSHPKEQTLALLLGIPGHQVKEALRPYKKHGLKRTTKAPNKVLSENRGIDMPLGFGPLKSNHRAYLEDRGLDPDRLERLYGVGGTGPVGPYKLRVVAPIRDDDGRVVSYQGRDITGLSHLKYKACPKDQELIHHKHILYAMDLAQEETVIICEGIVDAWKIGPGAVATFGTSWTREQAMLIPRLWTNVAILFDGEKRAQRQARKLANTIGVMNAQSIIFNIECGDPGELNEREVVEIKQEIKYRFGERRK